MLVSDRVFVMLSMFTYTIIVVAADDNAIAVDRRAHKTRAGSS